MGTRVRYFIAGLLLIISLAILLWGIWPTGMQTRQSSVSPAEMALSTRAAAARTATPKVTQPLAEPGQPPVARPTQPMKPEPTPVEQAIPVGQVMEQRLLYLEWPANLRLGDAGLIRMELLIDENGQLSLSTEGGQAVIEPVQIPDLYDTHTIIAQARLDMAGVEYRPQGEISQAMLPGQGVKFLWSVRPAEAGAYSGTVWLHLRLIPQDGSPERRIVLTAQIISLRSIDLLGMQGATARIVGSLGSVFGVASGADVVLKWGEKWARRKRRRPAKRR
jgi:hypothetical protein